ncbi:uncharacterized protein LOC129944538 isoform X2 [Eupeodes corollae]|uniref:uncharacterized protein LOC129944538 isoform X2 n=1 Tax=Eupeodes corollae TaxID=290404 RepID=UPI0024927C0D|nr:uncharacterized protein LOC129944538 isoform X2 [Eupeodes corollae]
MSNLSSSGSNDSVLEPLLQQHDDDDDDENKTPLTSSRKNEDANDTWLVSPTNHCTSTSKNKPNSKTDPASVKSRYTNKNLLRHCKKPSSIGQSISSIFTRRKRAFVLLGGTFLFLFYINSMIINRNSNQMIPVTHHSTVPGMKGYLVWSDKCKMPSIDPYTAEVMQYFKREKYEPCSTSKPLTKVAFNSTTGKYNLLIIQDQVKYYTKSGGQLDCCYQVIERKTGGEKADQEVGLSECLSFRNSAQIPNTADNILVKCKSKKKQTYINGHPMMPERPEIRKRLQDWKKSNSETKKPVSVLMIGIDSISRVNLIRAMPKTAQYLYDNEWFEMSGYNKMGDNTFPNLMAILTGYNQTVAFDKCAPTKLGALDRCPFIWKSFREHGYVTAYAEDESSINTFNYLKLGFEKPPVDYYLRPFLISAEHNLVNKLKSGLIFCLGYQHSADYIYDYALELATRYRDDPFFGLFWANTFSHNDISDCSSMDDKMQDYLKQLAKRGILDRSIVIFFSDHGMRFGPTRKFLSGHLEERLPFMFIWLPPGLKNSHTEFVNALSVNKNRLTNPYDLHMTLKHILELSGRVNKSEPSQGCPKCQTLLKPVPHSRSCDDAAIEDHWCTCIPYTSIYKGSNVVTKIAKYSINYINDYVADFKNGSVADRCALLSLSEVQSAYRALHGVDASTNVTTETYRIIFITKPNYGLFEATVRYTIETENMEVTGSISRLNSYASDSSCVSDGGAKKYCSCGKSSKNRHTAARAPAG